MTGKEIKKIRMSLGMSQIRFSMLFGVSCVTISRWERGAIEPSPYRKILIQTFKTAREKDETIGDMANIAMSQYGVIKALYILLKAAVVPSLQEVFRESIARAKSGLTDKEKKVLDTRFGLKDTDK